MVTTSPSGYRLVLRRQARRFNTWVPPHPFTMFFSAANPNGDGTYAVRWNAVLIDGSAWHYDYGHLTLAAAELLSAQFNDGVTVPPFQYIGGLCLNVNLAPISFDKLPA